MTELIRALKTMEVKTVLKTYSSHISHMLSKLQNKYMVDIFQFNKKIFKVGLSFPEIPFCAMMS